MIHNGHNCRVNACGLFVEEGSEVLATTPDRLATINGEIVVLEVKCLSASRELTTEPTTSLQVSCKML